jgi:uncharacterized repeat protein (TIGR03803 family)
MQRFLIETLLCWSAFGCLSFAQAFTLLHDFKGSPDGNSSLAGLIRDAKGNLYGTTTGGGSSGVGTVFKANGAGKETVLYSFAGTPDGASPHGALIRDSAGNLYGTTYGGGTSNFGTVFRVDPTGHETVLYSFLGSAEGDGFNPEGSLIMDAAGNLYGTTALGGAQSSGMVFKLAPDGSGGWTESVLYSFVGGLDGIYPAGGLVRDPAGNFYGTTPNGGVGCRGAGCGVVFKVSPSGKEAVLYRFTGTGGDGSLPAGNLLRDAATGDLYGTTGFGGTANLGTVFKLDPAGNETVLYSFLGPRVGGDGASPVASPLRDAAGNLYGTTYYGGVRANFGTVFKLDPAGNETVLYRFTGGTDGGYPSGGLVQDAAGILYGTTTLSGIETGSCAPLGCGSVFKLTP